ncbi:MAG: hypothetical protein H8F28_03195 [Fibrella sp.]|nr:hypothetical protein [Armatimonadota bacterium]
MTASLFVAMTAVLIANSATAQSLDTFPAKKTGAMPKKTAAMVFAKAGETWAYILADRKSLEEAIQTGQLPEVHDIVFSLRDSVVTLPYKSTALSPAKMAALKKRVDAVAILAERVDKYADEGDATKTKAEYARLRKELDAFEPLYPTNALPSSGGKPLSAADKRLFLLPGGLYTESDIVANGSTSPYQKYASVIPMHDAKVNPGDAVCPISETKPNAKLPWVIGGKTYIFCCPPCIGEFLTKAKTTPSTVKSPEGYIKK